MRSLVSARSLRGGTAIQAARRHQAPLPCRQQLPAPLHQRPYPAAAGAAAALRAFAMGGSDDSDGSSSSASSANGWLLDAPTSSAASSTTASSSSSSIFSTGSSGGEYDAIMMLGGGLLPRGGLPEWVTRRLEGCRYLYLQQQAMVSARQQAGETAVAAATIATLTFPSPAAQQQQQQQQQQQPWAPPSQRACPIVLLGAGTPHKPAVVDEAGFVLHESTAYAAYLMRRGVPAADLLKEAQSYDTVGNAYFSLLQHALPAGWRRIAVVTSDFHMARTQATFDFVYSLAGRQLHGDPSWYSLDYRPVSDEGIFDPAVLAARAEKEAAAVDAWWRNTSGLATLADLHAWIYATHLCYSVSRQHEFGREVDLDPRLAATY